MIEQGIQTETSQLGILVKGYLESEGFETLEHGTDVVVADKADFVGMDRDTRIVWTVPRSEPAGRQESRLRASISALRPRYRDARAYLVTESAAGFTRDFLDRLHDEGIKFLSPALFFDTPYKVEEMRRAVKSVIADARLEGARLLESRVPQRYAREGSNGGPADGDDLFDTLLDELGSGKPMVRIVVGRAGIGKSVLFNALFARLYDDFLGAKKRQSLRARPVPFLPAHLRDAYAVRLEVLFDCFLAADVASPVNQQTFRWLLTHGFSTWLFDGLDELYAGDPGFFENLADFLTQPGSRSQVTIFCRDSLLTTSDSFHEFRELCADSGLLTIYRLCEWDHRARRQFAWLGLEKRAPRNGEANTPTVTHFLQEVEKAPVIRELSGLPFYCELLLEEFRQGRLREHTDEVSMLEFIVDHMVQREIEKGVLDLSHLEPRGLKDWLEEIAVSYVDKGRYSEVRREDAVEYGRLVVRAGIDPTQQEHILLTLLQFPLFRSGPSQARFAFAHDLIADALAARGFLRALSRDPASVARKLSWVDLEEPTLLRLMSRRLSPEGLFALKSVLQGGGVQGRAFTILLALLMLARQERNALLESRLTFDGRDLSSIRFRDRDLSNMSFRGADLSYAVFDSCDLRNALFEGAFLRRTQFDPRNRLDGSQFGDADRAESVMVGPRLLEAPEEIRSWIASVTGEVLHSVEPCPTALQIRFLFGKFITPLGAPRRDELRRDGLLAGKRYPGSASAEDCLEDVVRHGYLRGPDHRNRFRRSSGELYSEMVDIVRDSRISGRLDQIVRELCTRKGCAHQLIDGR